MIRKLGEYITWNICGNNEVIENVETGFPPPRDRPTRRSVFANVAASMTMDCSSFVGNVSFQAVNSTRFVFKHYTLQ
jgi:hypothetical protein